MSGPEGPGARPVTSRAEDRVEQSAISNSHTLEVRTVNFVQLLAGDVRCFQKPVRVDTSDACRRREMFQQCTSAELGLDGDECCVRAT